MKQSTAHLLYSLATIISTYLVACYLGGTFNLTHEYRVHHVFSFVMLQFGHAVIALIHYDKRNP